MQVEDLIVTFGELRAVDGVSFSVGRGEAFGLLGPNGAGKTTTLRVITTLLHPDGGRAFVAGHDVRKESLRWPRLLRRPPAELRRGGRVRTLGPDGGFLGRSLT